MMRGQAHADKASHGEAGKMAGYGMQRFDERCRIVGQGIHVVTVICFSCVMAASKFIARILR